MKSPRRLPTLSMRELREEDDDDIGELSDMDEDMVNPFYLGATGKTPRPQDSVEQAIGDKMRDFVLQAGGGFASVDLRKIHQGPALVPEGVITIGKRPHVLQKGPPKALAKILHRLNRRRSLITRFFADRTLNRWKVSLLYILFRAWANVTASRPKTIGGMLKFINRARGRGVRFWFNRWHMTHNKRCRDNIRLRELKLLNEHRLRLLEIETNSMEAQQVNGLVAQDLQEKSEAVAQQAKDIRHLENNTKILENELEAAKKRLAKLDNLLSNPSLFIPERTSATLSEWEKISSPAGIATLKSIKAILTGLSRRPWQDTQISIGIESAARVYRTAQAAAQKKREEKERRKKMESNRNPLQFDQKHEHHINPDHPHAHAARYKFWELEIVDLDIHHVFHRLKKALENTRTLYGEKVKTAKSLFKALDADGDEQVTRLELWEGMQRLDLGLSELQLRTVLHAVDVDNSGTIEYSEFKTAFKKKKKSWRKWKEEKRNAILKSARLTHASVSKDNTNPNNLLSNVVVSGSVHPTEKVVVVEDMEKEKEEDKSPASRGNRDGAFRLRWFQSLADKEDVLLPQDLRDGKLWARVLDKLNTVSIFVPIFNLKQYEKGAGQERNRKRRIATVVKNLRKIGIFIPRTARTPAGFMEASKDIHLSIANEVMCRFPGIFASTGPLRAAEEEHASLTTQWQTLIQLHHIVVSRLNIVHSYGNIQDVDEMYIQALDEGQKQFFNIAHAFNSQLMQCYDHVKALDRGRKGGERRMLQCELSSSLENSNRLLQHLEDVKEEFKKSLEADGSTQALSAEEDRKDLLRYACVPGAWVGTVEERCEIKACLMANSVEARRIFQYYSYNGKTLSVDGFNELAMDAGVLVEINSSILVDVFRAAVHPHHPRLLEAALLAASAPEEEEEEEEATALKEQLNAPYIREGATAEQFIEICLRLARAMREHMNVADGLQDIWDEYMTQTRPPREQWSAVRSFMRQKPIIKAIEGRRKMLWERFQVHMMLSSNNVACVSRDEFYKMCQSWGHIVRAIAPGDINLMFAHATGTWDFAEIRQKKCPMIFPQFIAAIVALFLRGGVNPFLPAPRALQVYFENHLAMPLSIDVAEKTAAEEVVTYDRV
jgi:hypothetical protein